MLTEHKNAKNISVVLIGTAAILEIKKKKLCSDSRQCNLYCAKVGFEPIP